MVARACAARPVYSSVTGRGVGSRRRSPGAERRSALRGMLAPRDVRTEAAGSRGERVADGARRDGGGARPRRGRHTPHAHARRSRRGAGRLRPGGAALQLPVLRARPAPAGPAGAARADGSCGGQPCAPGHGRAQDRARRAFDGRPHRLAGGGGRRGRRTGWPSSATRCTRRASPSACAAHTCRASRRRCCSCRARATRSRARTCSRRPCARSARARELARIAEADHSFGVLKRSGRTGADVLEEVTRVLLAWLDRHRPVIPRGETSR